MTTWNSMNGWSFRHVPVSAALLLWLLFGPVLAAEESEDEAQPSLELLEFLGEWETADGRWLDPAALSEEAEGGVEEQSDE